MYLWHVPIFLLFEPRSWPEAVAMTALTVGVAALSMRYVEAPFLSRTRTAKARTPAQRLELVTTARAPAADPTPAPEATL